jgi:protein-tyrosine phosphatase
VIDLHSHVLPGLDDGAQTIEDSCELARAARADGIATIAATPHVRADYPTTADQMEAGVETVRRALAGAGIPVEIVPGGEIALDALPGLSREDLARFTLGASGRYLLVEFPYGGWPLDLEHRVFELLASGLTPILAHPERTRDVQNDPKRLARAVAGGALVQVTAAAIDGRLGRNPKGAATRLIELGLVHVLASDAHTPDIRAIGLSKALEEVGDEALGRWLVEDAPAAILAAEDLPDRPAGSRRRRFGVF